MEKGCNYTMNTNVPNGLDENILSVYYSRRLHGTNKRFKIFLSRQPGDNRLSHGSLLSARRWKKRISMQTNIEIPNCSSASKSCAADSTKSSPITACVVD
jgi:hypothetical protein